MVVVVNEDEAGRELMVERSEVRSRGDFAVDCVISTANFDSSITRKSTESHRSNSPCKVDMLNCTESDSERRHRSMSEGSPNESAEDSLEFGRCDCERPKQRDSTRA